MHSYMEDPVAVKPVAQVALHIAPSERSKQVEVAPIGTDGIDAGHAASTSVLEVVGAAVVVVGAAVVVVGAAVVVVGAAVVGHSV
jgi:hypothetical protein